MGLKVSNLSFSYRKDQAVLVDIDFNAIGQGMVACLIGANGAGKSTLFQCIAGQLTANEGVIELDGKDLHKLPKQLHREKVFYLDQEIGSASGLTIFESVLLALKTASERSALCVRMQEEKTINNVLEDLGIVHLADRPLYTLSGGQRQLASLAQALVRNPDVLLLDEPTSALDVVRQLQVCELIREQTLKRNIVTIVAMHDLALAARLADQFLLLSNGMITEQDTPEIVLGGKQVQDAYGINISLHKTCAGALLIDARLPHSNGYDLQLRDVPLNAENNLS